MRSSQKYLSHYEDFVEDKARIYKGAVSKLLGNEPNDSSSLTRILGVQYATLGLVGEAGEVADKVKKLLRDRSEDDEVNEAKRKEIGKELGDVMWYITALCLELDMSLEEVINNNISKLNDRAARDKLQGSGDNR